ncbi:hypothetical protein Pst134EA_019254 [Puccinia striiformis f. sp. tritici]|uniref:hypothetical protein n=1 Tax=Puccinia striiformis f. sp. tritici TaxID=168172 RepID=UPI00200832D1|nr:hypothetical protein Pst134EA_019254 [Puccinia striiformis f. sp. tritici]KAH9459103.1 hypothetical protein Pst134EA_019254 [Puccinia striiformis f. sp. tritici]
MYNIRYGRLGASDEEVQKVARLAKLDKSIEKWPSGWESLVGERGLMISGGERQRLAIASTSALDVHTEQELIRNISENLLNKHRTSVFIAHRLKTISDADLIIVLNEGKVVEQGNHEDLMNIENGTYRGMWLSQSVAPTENLKGKNRRYDHSLAPNHPTIHRNQTRMQFLSSGGLSIR